MNVIFDENFSKQLEKLNNPSVKQKFVRFLNLCEKAQTLSELPNVKKMKGTSEYFRFRSGRYRFGFILHSNGIIEFVSVSHRKDFYKHFPLSLFHFLFQNFY